MKKQNTSQQIKNMTTIAIFAALAYVSVIILRIPNIGGFLTFDFKDAIIIVASMLLGPYAAIALSILVPLLELIISSTGLYGFVMNMASSMALSLTASLIYKRKKTLPGAFTALGCSIVAVTAVMTVMNILVTPVYLLLVTPGVLGFMGFEASYKGAVSCVISLLPTLLLPFNFIKGFTNAAFAMALYKPVSNILKKSRLVSTNNELHERELTKEEKRKRAWRSVLVSMIAVVLVVTAIIIILNVWNVELSFFDVFKSK